MNSFLENFIVNGEIGASIWVMVPTLDLKTKRVRLKIEEMRYSKDVEDFEDVEDD